METQKLAYLFKATLDHNQRQLAEDELAQVCNRHMWLILLKVKFSSFGDKFNK